MADNYAEKTTGVNKTFSQEVEEENKKAEEAFKKFRSGEGPDPTKDNKNSKQSRMTKGFKDGGSICGRPTGKGFGKARKR